MSPMRNKWFRKQHKVTTANVKVKARIFLNSVEQINYAFEAYSPFI
jgi:hypothetical protein